MQLPPIDYRARIARLSGLLDGGAYLALAQPMAYRNSTVEHPWRQESTLYYLTGFAEPDAALVVAPERAEGDRVHLFLREKDPERELWDGRRLGIAAAKTKLAIDHAHPFDMLWEKLPDLLAEAKKLWCSLGTSEAYDREIIRALNVHKARHGRRGLACRLPVFDAQYLAGRMRLRKEPEEIERLRRAAEATRSAYREVFKTVRPGQSERDVHGLLLKEFLAGGAEMEAYGSIVAGGANACVLHYRDNDQALRDGELLLIDAGGQLDYYACDVTRTFPVGKRFTPEQKALYEHVLDAQKVAIARAVVGSSLPQIHEAAIDRLVDGMLDLKLLSGSKAELIAKGAFRKYYPHGTSHWIGMDVHDVGVYQDLGKPVALEPGMYFSVEPGLYVDPSDATAPAGLRGVGVRIEDDVLVTSAGPEVVTHGIAKEVHELENRF
jgi:Xaa-Pro aminopeptidase